MRRRSLLIQSERPPKHQHVHLKSRVRNTFKLLEAGVAASIRSFSYLQGSNDRETLALLTEANIFSKDLQRTVYNLQKLVIKTFENGVCDPQLDAVAKSFSSFAYSVQQSFNDDPESLKNQIKENLKTIIPETRSLVQVVESSTKHDYKHEVVDIIDDILFSVQKIELRNSHESNSPDNIVSEILKARDNIISKVDSFDTINPEVLRDLKHGIRNGYEKYLAVVHLLDQTADNYSDEIGNTLVNTSYDLIRDVGAIDAVIRLKSDVNSIKYGFKSCVFTSCLELENLVELLKQKIDDKQVANNLHNLIIQVVVYSFAIQEQQIRRLDWISEYANQ